MSGLPIRDVARRTGLAAGTIRMWEQRYGFPEPRRTTSGYRLYSEQEIEILSHAADLRRGGMSVSAALERARTQRRTAQASIFGAVPHEGRARRLRKRTLVALSRAIEDQTMASAARPLVMGSFQRARHYRGVEHRYQRLAEMADMTVVFADFGEKQERAEPGRPIRVNVEADASLGHEWAVVVDAPTFAACLSAWEPPVLEPPENDLDRIFETFWTLDPNVVREAARSGAACAREAGSEVGDEVDALLRDRPQAPDVATAPLEALTARMVAYLEAGP